MASRPSCWLQLCAETLILNHSQNSWSSRSWTCIDIAFICVKICRLRISIHTWLSVVIAFNHAHDGKLWLPSITYDRKLRSRSSTHTAVCCDRLQKPTMLCLVIAFPCVHGCVLRSSAHKCTTVSYVIVIQYVQDFVLLSFLNIFQSVCGDRLQACTRCLSSSP